MKQIYNLATASEIILEWMQAYARVNSNILYSAAPLGCSATGSIALSHIITPLPYPKNSESQATE